MSNDGYGQEVSVSIMHLLSFHPRLFFRVMSSVRFCPGRSESCVKLNTEFNYRTEYSRIIIIGEVHRQLTSSPLLGGCSKDLQYSRHVQIFLQHFSPLNWADAQ